jgi:hypothetical protein
MVRLLLHSLCILHSAITTPSVLLHHLHQLQVLNLLNRSDAANADELPSFEVGSTSREKKRVCIQKYPGIKRQPID